jgi:hypothetical protein
MVLAPAANRGAKIETAQVYPQSPFPDQSGATILPQRVAFSIIFSRMVAGAASAGGGGGAFGDSMPLLW